MHFNPLALPTILFAVVLYRLGSILGRKTELRAGKVILDLSAIVLALPGILFVFYYTHLFDSAAWFYRFRALPYTELTAAGIGLLAGVVNSWFAPETLGEKLTVPTALAVLLIIPFVKPALDPIDLTRLKARCESEVCMQSTFSTCGPSSAATILKLLGQSASEQELARESYTSQGGTEIWYLARAFERRGFRATVLIQPPDRLSPPSPAIAGVVLPGGAGHFIAIMSQNADEVTIGDPMRGKLIVKRADLTASYHFTGFFLAIREEKFRAQAAFFSSHSL